MRFFQYTAEDSIVFFQFAWCILSIFNGDLMRNGTRGENNEWKERNHSFNPAHHPGNANEEDIIDQ
jgi:hypothetical protein